MFAKNSARLLGRRVFSTLSGNRVSVIGAGQIGAACCAGILKTQEYEVRVYDPSEKNRSQLEHLGAKWVPTLEEMVEEVDTDVLVTALPAPPHVNAVMLEAGMLDSLARGSTWIDHTTTDPHEAVALHTKAASKGIHSLEAPLTGGYELLKAGMMTVLVGGDEEVFNRTEGLMRSYTETLLRMGDFGSASVVKIITNQLAAVHLIAAGEATMMAKRSRVDLQKFFDGVRASAGNSYVFETETPLLFNQSFDPGFTIDLHIKDLNIGRSIHGEKVQDSGTYDEVYPMSALAEKLYKDCETEYGPKVGSSYPAKHLQDKVGDPMACPGYDRWGYSIEKVTGGSIGVVHHKDKN